MEEKQRILKTVLDRVIKFIGRTPIVIYQGFKNSDIVERLEQGKITPRETAQLIMERKEGV